MTGDIAAAQFHPIEVAISRLHISRTKMFELLARGEIRSVKVGRRRLISEAALTEFIERIDAVGGDDAA